MEGPPKPIIANHRSSLTPNAIPDPQLFFIFYTQKFCFFLHQILKFRKRFFRKQIDVKNQKKMCKNDVKKMGAKKVDPSRHVPSSFMIPTNAITSNRAISYGKGRYMGSNKH